MCVDYHDNYVSSIVSVDSYFNTVKYNNYFTHLPMMKHRIYKVKNDTHPTISDGSSV